MEFQDKELTCRDCGNTFLFTAGEQAFYAEKGFQNEPQRCRDCRSARKQARGDGSRGQRELHQVICAACGEPTEVPFKPVSERPVYCRDCFSKMRAV